MCRVCGSEATIIFHSVEMCDRRKGVPGVWRQTECSNCGTVSFRPFPTLEQLAEYYDSYSTDYDFLPLRGVGAKLPGLRKLLHRLTGDVDPRDFVKIPNGSRILDYGSGQATYLIDFHDRGMSISGAEISEHLVDGCLKRGLDVHHVEDPLQIPFSEDEFDVVYLMQVFEHLSDPHKALSELSRVMRIGGRLYIALPNGASIWRNIFGVNWVSGWFLPFHLFIYNRIQLAKMAETHGFSLIKSWSITPESWFRLNLKAVFFPNERNLERRLSLIDFLPVRLVFIIGLRIIEFLVNERDCLVVELQKEK